MDRNHALLPSAVKIRTKISRWKWFKTVIVEAGLWMANPEALNLTCWLISIVVVKSEFWCKIINNQTFILSLYHVELQEFLILLDTISARRAVSKKRVSVGCHVSCIHIFLKFIVLLPVNVVELFCKTPSSPQAIIPNDSKDWMYV